MTSLEYNVDFGYRGYIRPEHPNQTNDDTCLMPINTRSLQYSTGQIKAGDQVLTFDGGLQTVIEVRRQILFAAATSVPYAWRPLQVPIGALGNRTTMHILPGQNVLIESDIAEELYGDPFALIPAAALEGYKGITRADPTMRIEVATLHFAQDQIVYANIGALFMCPRAGDLMHDLFATPVPTPYKALSMSEANMVLSWLEVEDAGIAACA